MVTSLVACSASVSEDPGPISQAGSTNISQGGDTGHAAGGSEGGALVGGQSSATGGATNSAGAPIASGGAQTASGGATGSGPTPVLPPISGECPTFVTGTATIGGLSGISLQVGPKKQGTGSLLFYWHGTGSTASEVNSLVPSAARSEILSQGGIIVSFQSSLGTGGDCSGTSTFSKDDFKIADLIAACAVRDYAIDPRRIYTTGCSAGGLQAGCMGALRSSYIAATAPNSGGEVSQQPIQDAAHTPAVMTMHGGTSDRVVVSFATTSATYDAQMKTAGSFVVNCNHSGGHCQAPAALYMAAWQFMKDHPFGEKPEPYGTGLPQSFPSYCMRY
jgi:dienelactone hydrolase